MTKSKEEMTLTERIRYNNPNYRRPDETEIARKARAGELPLKVEITKRRVDGDEKSR